MAARLPTEPTVIAPRSPGAALSSDTSARVNPAPTSSTTTSRLDPRVNGPLLHRFKPWSSKRNHRSTSIQLEPLPALSNGNSQSSIWQKAFNEHLSKLQPHDRDYIVHNGFSSGVTQEQVRDVVRSLELSYSRKLPSKTLARIYPIASHIQSFGRIVDVMVQSNPSIAALIWGGVRLVLEVTLSTRSLQPLGVSH